MNSRVFLLLGLLAAFVLLFASEVMARELAETTSATDKKDADGVKDAKYPGGGYGGYPGGGYGGYPGGGYGGYPGGGYGGYPGGRYGGGGRCRYGCCGGGGYYRRCRCCASAAEAAQKGVEVKPQN
ncbi:hypothetical protein SAY87_030752 [Trapa incisa]|uniref:Glycine-rich protein n=1 Tax=Trapa incisa TaxID=236973 RepID=A0AAN7KNZ6_9MYRT|nr:hypothetical protein SAY87_030752 [Trapa incisa]